MVLKVSDGVLAFFGLDRHGRPIEAVPGPSSGRSAAAASDAGQEVHRLVEAHRARRGVSYAEALAAVAADPEHEELVNAYTRKGRATKPGDHTAAGREVDRLARAYAERHGVGYGEALRAVLAAPEHAELVRVYGGGPLVGTERNHPTAQHPLRICCVERQPVSG